MNILVIGGTRFFGIHLVKSLLRRGHNVTIATRGRAKDEFGNNVERIIIERTDASSLAAALGTRSFDVVCDNLAYCSNDVKFLLDCLNCKRYVMTSSASVYVSEHPNKVEKDFDPLAYPLKWCSRQEFPYNEVKRQAECALFQEYAQIPSAAVRFPYVIGEDDYTKRLYFYIEQIMKSKPININNLNEEIGFVRSSDAGDFLAWIVEQEFTGPVNGSNEGSITLHEVINYTEQKTGMKAILSDAGETGPYNGAKAFTLNTNRAEVLGYRFRALRSWIFDLLDKYIEAAGTLK